MKGARTSRGIAIELCAGLGGIGLGLRAIGFDVRHAYDAWPTAVDVYNHNFGEERAKVCDLLSVAGRRTIEADVRRLDEIDLLVAGPPCKGFSQIKNGRHDGRRADNRVHNRVLKTVPSYVSLAKPRFFLVENVPALETHRAGRTLREIVKALENPAPHLRYSVSYRVYDAAHYGTPPCRRRLLIWGVRAGEGVHSLPTPDPDLRPLFAALRRGNEIPAALHGYAASLADPGAFALTTALQALADLPLRPAGSAADRAEYASTPKAAYQRRMRSGGGTTVSGLRTPAVKEETLDRLRHVPPGGCALDIPQQSLNGLMRKYHSAYRRLHPDAPSTALSTKYDCVYHYSMPRSLSLREYARLQGIPDWFEFPEHVVARRAAYEMIGNSVPPQLIEGVLTHALSNRR